MARIAHSHGAHSLPLANSGIAVGLVSGGQYLAFFGAFVSSKQEVDVQQDQDSDTSRGFINAREVII